MDMNGKLVIEEIDKFNTFQRINKLLTDPTRQEFLLKFWEAPGGNESQSIARHSLFTLNKNQNQNQKSTAKRCTNYL